MLQELIPRLLLGVTAVTIVLSQGAQAGQSNVDCDRKPNHPQCQPGNDSQEVTPARITYASGVGNDIEGDPGPQGLGIYEGLNSPDGLEVFIGSAANTGNIFLRQRDPFIDHRTLRIVIPEGTAPECGLQEGAGWYPLRFANAKPDAVLQDGVFSMAVNDEISNIPMKIMFLSADGSNQYFIIFEPSKKGPCSGDYVTVKRLPDVAGKRVWRVTPTGNACIEKHESKGKNKVCTEEAVLMTFSFDLEECPECCPGPGCPE